MSSVGWGYRSTVKSRGRITRSTGRTTSTFELRRKRSEVRSKVEFEVTSFSFSHRVKSEKGQSRRGSLHAWIIGVAEYCAERNRERPDLVGTFKASHLTINSTLLSLSRRYDYESLTRPTSYTPSLYTFDDSSPLITHSRRYPSFSTYGRHHSHSSGHPILPGLSLPQLVPYRKTHRSTSFLLLD